MLTVLFPIPSKWEMSSSENDKKKKYKSSLIDVKTVRYIPHLNEILEMQQFKFQTKPFCGFRRLGIQHTSFMYYFYGTFRHFL